MRYHITFNISDVRHYKPVKSPLVIVVIHSWYSVFGQSLSSVATLEGVLCSGLMSSGCFRWLALVPIASLYIHEGQNQKHLAMIPNRTEVVEELFIPRDSIGEFLFSDDSRSRMATSVNMQKQMRIGRIESIVNHTAMCYIAMAEKYGHIRFGLRKETALRPTPGPSRNDHTDPASNTLSPSIVTSHPFINM